jgi:predicted RNase H-like HicB family nuclease
MPVHDEILQTAQRLCRERGSWTFVAEEIVRALPHLNENSVRAHVSSRCCVNAPAHHARRWPYFRRLSRGRYEITTPYRVERRPSRPEGDRVAESAPRYGRARESPVRDTIHAVLEYDGRHYVAECLEIAVVTQGRTADEVLANLQDAIALHLEGEDLRSLGLTATPRLLVTYEVPVRLDAAEA